MAKRKVEDSEVRKIQDVPVGEFVRVKRWVNGEIGFTKKVYRLAGYDRSEREWMLDDMDDISRCRWVKTGAVVQVGFIY